MYRCTFPSTGNNPFKMLISVTQYFHWLWKKCKLFLLVALLFTTVYLLHAVYQENSIYRDNFRGLFRINDTVNTPWQTIIKYTTLHWAEKVNTKRTTEKPLLSYSQYFHQYPLDVDLSRLVMGKIKNNTEITIKSVNPHAFKYIHIPADCQFSQTKNGSKLAILVKSSVNNFSLRSAIRATWGNTRQYRAVTVFLLAGTTTGNQKRVDDESRMHSDIIQEDFLDSYMNNTYKTIMGFNWAAKHCSEADFFFFVDDDHFVLVSNIVSYINTFPPDKKENTFEGYLLSHSVPYRDRKSKWYISRDNYPFNIYPPYLAGGAFLSSYSVVKLFSLAFPYVKYIGIDDSYLGIVAKKLNIIPKHNRNFYHRVIKLRLTKKDTLFASHGFQKPEDVIRVYNSLKVVDRDRTRSYSELLGKWFRSTIRM